MDNASTSGRSFRERILTASIKFGFRDSPNPSTARVAKTSDSSPTIEVTGSDSEPKSTVTVEEDDLRIEPVTTDATYVDKTESERNMGSVEDQTPPGRGRSDPLAGGFKGGVNYKSMLWWQAGMVMVAETISLGILSLPMALSELGMIPGLILLIFLGIMASYSGYTIGRFKLAHPHITSMADAGEVMFGRVWGEIIGVGLMLFFLFIMASHILTFSVMMNAITDHRSCTVIFMFVGMVISFVFSLPRELKNLSHVSIISFISIIGAVMIIMIGLGIDRPGFHVDKTTGQTTHDVRLWPKPDITFHGAFLAVANMVFAYAGHVAFFGFISELKNPADFPKALAVLQISDITMYIVTAIVVYYFAGNRVASPALDSAKPLIRKIAYGIAIPTIVIAGVVNGNVAVKHLYVKLLKNDKDDTLHKTNVKALGYWVGLCAAFWIAAWIIAESIPVFNDLLGVTSALFASWFTYGLSGMFWFHMNFKRGADLNDKNDQAEVRTEKPWTWIKTIALIANIINILLGAAICVIGLYASGRSMALNSQTKKPFSCADNSGFQV